MCVCVCVCVCVSVRVHVYVCVCVCVYLLVSLQLLGEGALVVECAEFVCVLVVAPRPRVVAPQGGRARPDVVQDAQSACAHAEARC